MIFAFYITLDLIFLTLPMFDSGMSEVTVHSVTVGWFLLNFPNPYAGL